MATLKEVIDHTSLMDNVTDDEEAGEVAEKYFSKKMTPGQVATMQACIAEVNRKDIDPVVRETAIDALRDPEKLGVSLNEGGGCIMVAFEWGTSKQGHRFWRKIYEAD